MITETSALEMFQELQHFSRYLFFSPDSRKRMEQAIIEDEGERFVVKVRDDGKYGVEFPMRGFEVIASPSIITHAPMPNTAANYEVRCLIENPEIIPAIVGGKIHRLVQAFVSSAFTRSITFCSLAYFQPVSLEAFSKAIASKNES